jgi:hypothetical protein
MLLSVGSFRMVATSCAPCRGGFEYMGRATRFIWLSTAAASLLLPVTMLHRGGSVSSGDCKKKVAASMVKCMGDKWQVGVTQALNIMHAWPFMG